MTTNEGPSLPLDGVKVLDFSRLLPGPWCTQLLSDLGARVIKVEIPETGDMSRHNPPGYKSSSAYFEGVNGGKESISLNMANTEGKDIARRLIKTADVVVESFRPGVASKLGMGYNDVKAENPKLVYCSISGFGQDGPLAHISGHDLAIQAQAGFVGLSALGGQLPQVPPFQAADYAGGAMASIAVLSALMRRGISGEGSYLDIAMFDSLFAMCNITHTAGMVRSAGHSGTPAIEVWGGNPRYSIYGTKDNRAVAVALLETRLWVAFCEAIGRHDLIRDEDPDARHSDHGEMADEYRSAIANYCLSKNLVELIEEMTEHGVPITPVATPDEALASTNVAGRGLITTIDHPHEGRIPQMVNTLAKSGLGHAHRTPAPRLGADNNSVLEELGLSKDDVQQLQKSGVIGE